jgi:hypothetical protein
LHFEKYALKCEEEKVSVTLQKKIPKTANKLQEFLFPCKVEERLVVPNMTNKLSKIANFS